jgi:hypothetical protein
MTTTHGKIAALCVACWYGGIFWEPFCPVAWASSVIVAVSLWWFIDSDLRGKT